MTIVLSRPFCYDYPRLCPLRPGPCPCSSKARNIDACPNRPRDYKPSVMGKRITREILDDLDRPGLTEVY